MDEPQNLVSAILDGNPPTPEATAKMRELAESLKNHQGDQVLVIKRDPKIQDFPIRMPDEILPRWADMERSFEMGIIEGVPEIENGRHIVLPMAAHAEHTSRSYWETWNSKEGPIKIGHRYATGLDLPTPLRSDPNQRNFHGLEIYVASDVQNYFRAANADSNHFEEALEQGIKPWEHRYIAAQIQGKLIEPNLFYVQALDLLGRGDLAPADMRREYDAVLKARAEEVITKLVGTMRDFADETRLTDEKLNREIVPILQEARFWGMHRGKPISYRSPIGIVTIDIGRLCENYDVKNP